MNIANSIILFVTNRKELDGLEPILKKQMIGTPVASAWTRSTPWSVDGREDSTLKLRGGFNKKLK